MNWHKTLHGEDTGTDERLRPLTLKSIPKLRNFVNDTLLDILFYTSPVYCQTILDTVTSEINRLYTLFLSRNEEFKGKVSLIGHSLGSLIAFDILSHQGQREATPDPDEANASSATNGDKKKQHEIKKPIEGTEATLEELFAQLDISEFVDNFAKEGIDMEALMLCTEDDLKEGGLPLGPRKKLLKYIDVQRAIAEHRLSGLEQYDKTSVTSDVKYRVGPAGTGQPCVVYPKLDFEPASFYALGSPIALFHAVRGIRELGPMFQLPTCPKFFNIFHPYDPVAYRIESLISQEMSSLRPVTIPHHMGRKRMHLELKDTVRNLMTGDIKKKLVDSVWSSISALYNWGGGGGNYESATEQKVNEAVEQKLASDAAADDSEAANVTEIDSMLNEGRRIDYVLQEAPYESFNEYVFALGSHLCYWESEDTVLMILKDIYSLLDGVISDEELNQQASISASASSASIHLPPVDDTPTAILRPPPTPMGAPMMTTLSSPSNTGADSTSMGAFVGQPAAPPQQTTAQQPPPPSISPPMSFGGPPPMTSGGPAPPPSAVASSATLSNLSPSPFDPSSSGTSAIPPAAASIGPPPPMMAPTAFPTSPLGGPPPATQSTGFLAGGRPKRAAYPMSPGLGSAQPPPMGMDPTAPSSDSRPIGPPPTMGFTR